MTPGWRRFAAPLAVLVVGAAVAAIFHARLYAWFTGQPADAASRAVHVTAGPLDVAAALRPDPPRQNGNTLVVELAQDGAPVDGAQIVLTYDMPAMGAMAEMKGTAAAVARGGGRYEATYDLPMGGSWKLIVDVARGELHATARYAMTVGSTGLTAQGGEARRGDAASAPGAIEIDDARRAALGITLGDAAVAPMALEVRALGRVTYDETRLTDVTLKLGGFITDLRVAATGQPVRKGETLFTLYSPDLYAAQQDYLLARKSVDAATAAGTTGARTDALVRAAEKKLALWGLSPTQIAQLAARGEPLEDVAFAAPASGYVIEKNVVEGAAVEAGERLFRIAALDQLWVEADLYEADLPLVAKGQPASIALDHLPGHSYDGTVAFVYPYLDPQSRSGRVRIALANKALELKPDMAATVIFHVALGPRLQIPLAAVIYTGPRRLVFIDKGGGRLEPREVTLGARAVDRVEVIAGLAAGDRVVTSGNFLVAAESRLRSPSTYWQDTP